MKKLFKMIAVLITASLLTACGLANNNLESALQNTREATSYTISFTFTAGGREILASTIDFDGNVARRTTGSMVSFYENTNDRVYRYDQFGDVWQRIEVTTEANNAFIENDFLSNLAAHFFERSNDVYTLLPEHYEELGELFGGAPVSNLTLTRSGNYVNEVNFIVIIDGVTVNGRMVYSNFGNVSLTLPVL